MKLAILTCVLCLCSFAQKPVAPGQINSVSGDGKTLVTTTGTQTSGDCVKIDAAGNHVANGSACSGGSGTVTSVGLSMPPVFCSVSNSPVSTTGTLTCTLATGQTPNLIFGSNSSGNVGLMNLTTAQLPSIASTFLSDSSSLVRTSDTGSVTNTMLAGSIANGKLTSSSLTIAGHSVSLGGTQAIACADLSNASASCATDATTATNITAGTLPNARIVSLPNANLANSQVTVNTTSPLTGGGAVALGATITAACATCATTTNGGALSATAPEAISAGGVISTTDTTAYDNSIVSSSVDASGNPNYLGTAGNTVLPINGGTTSLVMYIAGLKQILNSNVTLTLPVTASVQQWILAKQDTGNANMVAGDFLGMNTAPFYGYAAPTCPSPSPALSSTNPAFWFDMSTGLSKLCTSNAGSYAASPAIVLGVVNISVTPAITSVLSEPLRLSPLRRVELFGSGADGTLTVTSGTTTIDQFKQYQSAVITGGTLSPSACSANSFEGVSYTSQNPVLVAGGTITAKGTGTCTVNGGTGAGSTGADGGLGGGAGGGGGSGTTSAAGGAGGRHQTYYTNNGPTGNGTAGSSAPTAGGNATSATSMYPQMQAGGQVCSGAQGGAGAGDGTHAGGSGGAGGGLVYIRAPSIFVASGVSVIADGNDGGAGSAANAGGGGGGGGGCVILNAGFISSSGATITANGGASGAKGGAGTGTIGGTGAAGSVQQNRLW